MLTAARAVLLSVILGLVAGLPAAGQSLGERRLIVGASWGVQFVKDAVTNQVQFELYRETGTFRADYDITTDTAIDGGLAYRLWRRLGVGIDVSHFHKLMTASIVADVPHPFFFSFPRTTTGSAGGVTRRELGIHLQAQYWHRMGDDLLIRGFAGPTVFDVSHDLVSAIVTEEVGGDFSAVNLVGHETTKTDKTAGGFNIGVDIAYFGLRRRGFLGDSPLLDRIGLSFVLRYSRGTSPVAFAGQSQPALELGGTHAGLGLRVVF